MIYKYTCALCGTKFERIKLSVSKSGLRFCSRKCKDEGQKLKYNLKDIWPNHYDTGIPDYRQLGIEYYGKSCLRCGFDKAVVVHHRDRNRQNNQVSNLEVLCYNCHAIEHKVGMSQKGTREC